MQDFLDMRLSEEAWRLESNDKKRKRVQQSYSLTFTRSMASTQWLALGFHYGKSRRAQDANSDADMSVSGWQFDLGYIYSITDDVDLSIFANQEQRKNHVNKTKIGSFKDEDDSFSELSRFGIEVRYLLSE